MSGDRLVGACGWAAGAFGILGFAASVGHGALPELPAAATWPLHLLLLGAGLAAALVAARRAVEIDRERFHYASDPLSTSEEVKLAHREAERKHKVTTLTLVLAPVLLAYWLAYELPAEVRLARALPASPLVGFGLGLLLGRRQR